MPGGPHIWLICPCSLQAPHLQPRTVPLASPPALGAPGRAAYLPGSWHHNPVRSADPTAPLQCLFPGPAWTGTVAVGMAARLTLQPGVRILPLFFQAPHLPPAAPGAHCPCSPARHAPAGSVQPPRLLSLPLRAARLRPGSLCRPPARAAASPPGGSSELAEPTTQPARLRLRKQGHRSSRRPSASRRPAGSEAQPVPPNAQRQWGAGRGRRGHRTPRCARLQSNTGTLTLQKGRLPLASESTREACWLPPPPAPNQVPLASTEQGTAPRPCPCVPEDIPEPSMGPEGEAGSGAGTGWPLPGCRGTAHGCQEAARVTHLSTDMHIRVSGRSFLCYEICIWPRVPTTQSHPLRHQILGRALFTGGRRAAAAWI